MDPGWNREQILEELQWGNRYFLNMQNVGGYITGLCELYELIPEHKDASEWKEAIRMYCEDYTA